MTREQLEAVRAEKWRLKANPLLTQEESEAWIDATGISLFVPRHSQLRAPAPSFVEAVLGEANPTPPLAAIENAFALARRLFAAETAVPLNLLGAVSEQPDFLVSPEALPYIFALRGDRDWKRGPRDKSSPLVVETWKALQREGVLTASDLQGLLGREVTEAAIIRSLSALWTAMRVLPVYVEGEPTSWELFEARHQKAMQAGAGAGQAVALSALISLYLDAVVAATPDEIEAFLSPLATRSRIRDAVRGLEATRQLSSQQLGVQPVYYITGALPELPEIAPSEEETASSAADSQGRFAGNTSETGRTGARRPFARSERTSDTQDRPRKPIRRDDGPARRSFGDRPSFGKRPAAGGPRREFKPREGQGEFRPRREGSESGFKKPFEKREGGERPARRSFGGARPSFGKRPAAGGPRREFKPREGQGEFRPRREGSEGGFKKPFEKREGGERPARRSFGGARPSFGKRPAAGGPRREFKPREGQGEFRPRREGSEGGFKKPFEKREGGERPARRSFGGDRPSFGNRPAAGGPRREFKPREGQGEFRPRREGSEGGFKKPFEKREGGDRPARRSFGSDRPSYGKRPAAGGPRREFKPREGQGEFRPRREGSEGGFKKPFEKREGGDRPARRSFGGDRPSFGKRPATGGPRREFKPREGQGEFRPRREGSEGGFKKPFEKREGGDRPARRSAPSGDSGPRREFKPRSSEGSSAGAGGPRRGPGDFAPRRKTAGPGGPAKKSGSKFGGKTSKFGAKKPSFRSGFGSKSGPKGAGRPAPGKRKKKTEE